MTISIRRSVPLLVMAVVLPCPLAPQCRGGGVEPAYFDVARGAHPHDVAAAPAPGGPVYYTAQTTGKLGILDPEDRQVRGDSAGSQFGAAWRDRRARRRAVDHRRRPECDRARRPEDARGARLAARQGRRVRQPQHAHVRREGPRLVHRPDRLLRPARPRHERHEGVEGAARARSLRHRDDAGRRRLLRVARRQPHRAHRHRNRRGDRHRAADAGPGRAPRLVRFEGPDLGQLLEHRPGRDVRPGVASVARMEAAGQSAARVFGLGRRPGQGLAHRMDAPTRSSGSIRSRRSSRAFRRTARAPTCARCSAAPAKPGARNRATRGW